MGRRPNSVPSSSNETTVIDAKPLRSLAPMYPFPFGHTTFSPAGAAPYACISPFTTSTTGTQTVQPSAFPPVYPGFISPDNVPKTNDRGASPARGTPNLNGSPIVNSSPHTPSMSPSNDDSEWFDGTSSASGRKVKRATQLSSSKVNDSGTEGTEKKRAKRKKSGRPLGHELFLLPSSSEDGKELVEVILMTFDALRRRILQLEEVSGVNRFRPDLKAGAIMMDNDLRANMTKRIGPVPGIEVGDIFYFRIELCLVGLHHQSMGGIDYMSSKFDNEDEPLAISLVSSGGYENVVDDPEVLIYSGQGGGGKTHDKNDQKLERGNLALERSLHRSNEIRVTRATKDLTVQTGKIYFYDGIYKIHETWIEKGKSGFNVFKYRLRREPGQPDGLAVWKMTENWRASPSSRGKVILPDMSSGEENIPVCLVNEVDTEKGPGLFSYTTRVSHSTNISFMKPLHGCSCQNVCIPGDATCSCANQNGGDLPYSSTGLLVRRKPLIYECSASCHCSVNCRNRVTQKGIKLHLEVFKTTDRGWGLRSWDPIRAGTFICEYTGEVIEKAKVEDDGEEDEYIFEANADYKAFKWNYGPELLGEAGGDDSQEISRPLPIIISAKKIGNISRFMNHSCSPNVFWQPVQHDHSDEGYPHIMFFAIKHIPPMTELTYDYGQSLQKEKRCLCKSPRCRGVFG